ncbi:exopolysaccharide biosynthesis protein [Salipiger pallidus]|uniref:exopolysaccharide biosynthesis protein n=1 Tax=Salipiger pallidus TaxID=1775170 RepID=UPI001E5CF39D|nr:exopolysaccharide biosynthesis protein [Salipiger pallidus]
MPALVERLHKLADGAETVSFAELNRTIGAQGHAPLLMVVSIFMILPIGMIPGIGGALGAIVALIGLQMLLGREGIGLPAVFGRRTLSAERLCRAADRIRPVADWLRKRLRPRWSALAEGRVSLSIMAILLMIAGGSLLVLGAIPVMTPLLGLPVAVFALGVLGRDGLVVAAGYVLLGLVILGGMWMKMSSG